MNSVFQFGLHGHQPALTQKTSAHEHLPFHLKSRLLPSWTRPSVCQGSSESSLAWGCFLSTQPSGSRLIPKPTQVMFTSDFTSHSGRFAQITPPPRRSDLDLGPVCIAESQPKMTAFLGEGQHAQMCLPQSLPMCLSCGQTVLTF